LEWTDIDLDRMQIVVDKSLDLDGSTKATKTRRNRVASIPRIVKADLRTWKKQNGHSPLVFPRTDGHPVDRAAWNNWRKRTIGPIQDYLGIARFRLYDLRHVAVSARLSAGQNPLQVAYETGHDPSVMFSTYSHFLPGTDGPRKSHDEMILDARRKVRVPMTEGHKFTTNGPT
jgi:integrase